jgi:hypothetical protein
MVQSIEHDKSSYVGYDYTQIVVNDPGKHKRNHHYNGDNDHFIPKNILLSPDSPPTCFSLLQ